MVYSESFRDNIFTLSFHSFHGFGKLASDVSLRRFLHNSGSSTPSFVAISF